MVNIEADITAISKIPAVSAILEVICRSTGMGFAAVARVTETKWVTCAVRDEINFGLVPGSELVLETTICNEIRQHHSPVVIDHVNADPAFADHPTPARYGFQSYISVPITRKNGDFFGTLCAIDPKPAQLNNPQIIGMFTLFADLIAMHLHAVEQLEVSNAKLLEQENIAQLREQFIAILGHDLRNPVGAVLNISQLLLRMPLDDRTKRLAAILQDASYRMKALIENILDFARGRLGEGIRLNRTDDEAVEKIVTQVTNELQLVWPNRIIETSFNLNCGINCDGSRIAQMYSNLLGNALTHGDKDAAVQVNADAANGQFTIRVTNRGVPIPDKIKEKLFEPFARGEVSPDQHGLGLGLYISSEIAKAHNGSIEVSSDVNETCFLFKMPI